MQRRLMPLLCGLWLLVSPALAQMYDPLTPKKIEAQSMMWPWIYGMVFLVGCLVVAFKPAQRSNLK